MNRVSYRNQSEALVDLLAAWNLCLLLENEVILNISNHISVIS
jgi:hypothetical protein